MLVPKGEILLYMQTVNANTHHNSTYFGCKTPTDHVWWLLVFHKAFPPSIVYL